MCLYSFFIPLAVRLCHRDDQPLKSNLHGNWCDDPNKKTMIQFQLNCFLFLFLSLCAITTVFSSFSWGLQMCGIVFFPFVLSLCCSGSGLLFRSKWHFSFNHGLTFHCVDICMENIKDFQCTPNGNTHTYENAHKLLMRTVTIDVQIGENTHTQSNRAMGQNRRASKWVRNRVKTETANYITIRF